MSNNKTGWAEESEEVVYDSGDEVIGYIPAGPNTSNVVYPTGIQSNNLDVNSYRNLSVLEATKKWQQIIGITPDGAFGPATELATKSWQSAHNISPDGVVGPATWAAAIGVVDFPYPPTIYRVSGTVSKPSTSVMSTSVQQPVQVTTGKPGLLNQAGLPLWIGLGLVGAAIWKLLSDRDKSTLHTRRSDGLIQPYTK